MSIQLLHQQRIFHGISTFPSQNLYSLSISHFGPSTIKIIPPRASSSSFGGISDYPGPYQDVEKKQKRDRIAGVDQDEVLNPMSLADPDSCFCEFKGVQIHHKVCDPGIEAQDTLQNQIITQLPNITKKVSHPMVLLHGFGASLFSWHRVMKPLSMLTGSKVLAFDRPAFGLTSRVGFSRHSTAPGGNDTKSPNPYSMAFAVLATLYFIDFLVDEKVILVAHSSGSYVAIDSYFKAPERVGALILVAPAIFAPRTVHKAANGNQQESDKRNLKEGSTNLLIRFSTILLKLSNYFAQAIMQMAKGLTDTLANLYKKTLSAVLRSAFAVMLVINFLGAYSFVYIIYKYSMSSFIGMVYFAAKDNSTNANPKYLIRMIINKFGVAGIRSSWYDSSQVTDHVLDGYTKPLKIKNWDKALLEYTVTMLNESKPSLAKRLQEISCPVLIVTGDSDRIVPTWNAERLSRVIPRSHFEVIKQCGHLPHEEKAEEFVSVIERFLQRFVYNSEERSQQSPT